MKLFVFLVSSVAFVKAAQELGKKIEKVNSDYELFSSPAINGKELEVFRKIVADYNEDQPGTTSSGYDKWISAMETDSDTLRAFLLMEAIDKEKFKFAGKIIDDMSNKSGAIIRRLKGGVHEEHESVFLRLERVMMDGTIAADQRVHVLNLREKVMQKLFDVSFVGYGLTVSDVDKAFENKIYVKSYAGIVNNFVHSDDKKNYYYNVRELKKAIEWDWKDLTLILFKNYLKTSGLKEAAAIEKLADEGLYRVATVPSMIKLLQKLGIPIMNGHYSVREAYNTISDQERRAEMMDLMKLSLEYDKKKFKDMNDQDEKLTMREAIMTGDWKMVAVQFVKPDIGVYQKEWIPLATKFCGYWCFDSLLMERVPLPSSNVLESAYAMAKDADKWTVEKYRKKMEEYREFYDEEGVCREGPLGCDKVKYEAYMKKKKDAAISTSTVSTSSRGASGTSAVNVSGCGTTNSSNTSNTLTNLIATFKSECMPLDP